MALVQARSARVALRSEVSRFSGKLPQVAENFSVLSFCFLVVYKPGVKPTLKPISNGNAGAGTNALRCPKTVQ